MAKRKSNQRTATAQEPTFTITDVKDILAKVVEAEKLKGRSADTYARHLSLFSRDMEQPNIATLLNNYNDIDTYIQTKTAARSGQPLTIQTKKSYYITLRALAEHLPFVNDEAKAFYIKKQDEFNKQAMQQSGENKPPERFAEEGLPPWSDVAELYKRFSGTAKYGINHLLVAFYTLIPPRRSDYRTLIYLAQAPTFTPRVPSKKRDRHLRDKSGNPYNFIYPVEGTDTYDMVLTQYKTNDRYGVYKTTLPVTLANIIRGYIKKFKIQTDTVLFRTSNVPSTTGEPFTPVKENSWSNKVMNAFKVKYDKHTITIGNLRHMYITSHIVGALTTNEKQAIALAMGHSVEMQDRYRQHNATNGELNEDVDEAIPIEQDVEEVVQPQDNDNTIPTQQSDNIDAQQDNDIDTQLKLAKLEMLKAQTQMLKAQQDYYKAKTTTLND